MYLRYLGKNIERLNNVSKNNVFAARVELFQISEAAGGFETGPPLTSTSTSLTCK